MDTQDIIKRLENIYSGEPWFGESLQVKLDSITSAEAYQRPAIGKHSMAEILSHMEFWRKSFVQQLKGEDSSSFNGQNPDNWRSVDELKKTGWENQCNTFEKTHYALLELLKTKNQITDDLAANLNGLIDHDIYHMGQIGFVKSLIAK